MKRSDFPASNLPPNRQALNFHIIRLTEKPEDILVALLATGDLLSFDRALDGPDAPIDAPSLLKAQSRRRLMHLRIEHLQQFLIASLQEQGGFCTNAGIRHLTHGRGRREPSSDGSDDRGTGRVRALNT